MVDFKTPTVKYVAKREYKSNFGRFTDIITSFYDTPSKYFPVSAKDVIFESYVDYVNLEGPNGKITIRVESNNSIKHSNAIIIISDPFFAQFIVGYPATATVDTEKRNWKVTLTGITNTDLDKFIYKIDDSYAYLYYIKESTLSIIETWSDTVPALSTEKS